MRASLRLLFVSKDLSLVKRYLQRQLAKVLADRAPLRDFVFAKEVRLGTYSAAAGATLPAAAIVAGKALAADPRAEPKFGERVRYVVVHGEPGARLMELCVAPGQLVDSGGALRLNARYYAEKQIVPALQRCLGLVGADVPAWLRELPAATRARYQPFGGAGNGAGAGAGAGAARTMDAYLISRHCAVCGELTSSARVVCEGCAAAPPMAVAALGWRAARLERVAHGLHAVCASCGGGGGGGVECVSLDCPVYFERRKLHFELEGAKSYFDAAAGGTGGLSW